MPVGTHLTTCRLRWLRFIIISAIISVIPRFTVNRRDENDFKYPFYFNIERWNESPNERCSVLRFSRNIAVQLFILIFRVPVLIVNTQVYTDVRVYNEIWVIISRLKCFRLKIAFFAVAWRKFPKNILRTTYHIINAIAVSPPLRCYVCLVIIFSSRVTTVNGKQTLLLIGTIYI